MRVEVRGKGKPEYAVLGSVHGDEPCGKRAIERFLSEEWELNKAVKFVVVNEEALEANERYLEADLNRVFPGDSESDKHEERLAAEVTEEIKGLKMIDIHSTRSEPVPFVNFSDMVEETVSMVKSTGVPNAVHFPESSGTSREPAQGVIVEAGPQGTDKAADMAYEILVNFLAAEGVIDAEYEKSDPELYRYIGGVDGSGYEFLGRNFEKVEEGEVFAVRNEDEVVAEEDFYPVLMSTDGYAEKVGLKAKKIEGSLS